MTDTNQSSEGKTKHITFGFVFAWIFAVLFGIPGIMMVFEHQVGSGILFIIAALVALPPFNTLVKEKWHVSLSGGLRFTVIVILVIIAVTIMPHKNDSSPSVSVPASQENSVPNTEAVQTPSQPVEMQTLLSQSGNGTKTTEKFTAASDWDLNWNYDCSNFGGKGNFQVMIYNGDGSISFNNALINQLGANGSDVEHYHTGGTYYLVVNSECKWNINVKG